MNQILRGSPAKPCQRGKDAYAQLILNKQGKIGYIMTYHYEIVMEKCRQGDLREALELYTVWRKRGLLAYGETIYLAELFNKLTKDMVDRILEQPAYNLGEDIRNGPQVLKDSETLRKGLEELGDELQYLKHMMERHLSKKYQG